MARSAEIEAIARGLDEWGGRLTALWWLPAFGGVP